MPCIPPKFFKRRLKRPYFLLEVLLAMGLFVLCAVPLFRTQVLLQENEYTVLRELQAHHLSTHVFGMIKEDILEGRLRWSDVCIDSISDDEGEWLQGKWAEFKKNPLKNIEWNQLDLERFGLRLEKERHGLEAFLRLGSKDHKDDLHLIEALLVLYSPKMKKHFYFYRFLFRAEKIV
ncbi:MAG: hypothetical protein CMO81_04575 [Waddliaceae bacterium]|nr:hypothetical protein [Waddliaceae bacterium]